MPHFFRLSSSNALIQFLLEVILAAGWEDLCLTWGHFQWGELFVSLFKGTPEIREHYIDSKKDVDRHLKSACEQFIQQQTKQFVDPLEEFLTKVFWVAIDFLGVS